MILFAESEESFMLQNLQTLAGLPQSDGNIYRYDS